MARLIILSGIFKACLTKIQWYNWAGLRLTITISIRQFHILPSAAATHAPPLHQKKVIFAKTYSPFTHTRLCSGCCGVICYGPRIMWLSRGFFLSRGQAKQGNIIEWRTGFETLHVVGGSSSGPGSPPLHPALRAQIKVRLILHCR